MRTIAVLLALTVTCSAQVPPAPPQKYDHPFAGEIEFKKFDVREVAKECDRLTKQYFRDFRHYPSPNPWEVGACTIPINKKRCIIVLPSQEMPDWWVKAVIRHETGHCNGWPGDHRGARPG